jgi:hypothetical protein
MIFVAMSCNTRFNAVRIFTQVREVWQHQVDAVHVCIGKHQTTIDKEQPIVLLDHHAVATYLA